MQEKVRLRDYFDKYRINVVLSFILTVLSVLFMLSYPLVLAFVVDALLLGREPNLPGFLLDFYDATGGRDFYLKNIWIMGLVLIVLVIFRALTQYGRNILMSNFAQTGTVKLRRALFAHIQRLPWSWHKLAETGDLVQRCTSDVRTVSRYFDVQIMRMVHSALSFILSAYLMFRFDASMGWIALSITPVLFISSYRYFKSRRANWILWEEAEGALSARLQETVTGIRVVKAFGREDFEHRAFTEKNDELYKFSIKSFQIMSRFWFWSDLLVYGELAAIVVFGTWRVLQGHLSPGLLMLFVAYSERLLYPLRNLARLIAQTGSVQIAAGRLREILEAPEEPDESHLLQPELKGNITFENLSFVYPDGDLPVLENLNFEIKAGETIGILGATGSGKSTLLLLLQKLYLPTSGRLLLDGIDVREIDRDHLRREIGLILQESYIYSRPIGDNIGLPKREADPEEIIASSKLAQLHGDVSKFKLGYDTMVGERGVTLSGGQKQRLAIARSLIRECPVLIFDDSLSALDAETDSKIRRDLKTRAHSKTTLIVSHRVSSLMDCDKILVLDAGTKEAFAPPAELKDGEGLFGRVYDLQSAWAIEAGKEA